jgi:hypothetical protein
MTLVHGRFKSRSTYPLVQTKKTSHLEMLHFRVPFKSKRPPTNVRKSHPDLHHDTSQPPDIQPTVTVGSLLCVCIVYRLNRSSQWTIHTHHCAARRKGKRYGPNCWPCFAMLPSFSPSWPRPLTFTEALKPSFSSDQSRTREFMVGCIVSIRNPGKWSCKHLQETTRRIPTKSSLSIRSSSFRKRDPSIKNASKACYPQQTNNNDHDNGYGNELLRRWTSQDRGQLTIRIDDGRRQLSFQTSGLKPAIRGYLEIETTLPKGDAVNCLDANIDRTSIEFDFTLSPKSKAMAINAVAALLATNHPCLFPCRRRVFGTTWRRCFRPH